MYLDFDGCVTTGSWWNAAIATIITPPYGTDNLPGSFSLEEKKEIVAMWRGVAEDYAAFDVDITTEDPGGCLRYTSACLPACLPAAPACLHSLDITTEDPSALGMGCGVGP